MERFTVLSNAREVMLDITAKVQEALDASGVESGIAVVYSPHTTAGITINENADPDVARDMLAGLRSIAPCDDRWRHCEGNSDAHIKASILGSSATVPVEGGRLALGTWQGIYLAEFDGPRSRNVIVQLVGR